MGSTCVNFANLLLHDLKALSRSIICCGQKKRCLFLSFTCRINKETPNPRLAAALFWSMWVKRYDQQELQEKEPFFFWASHRKPIPARIGQTFASQSGSNYLTGRSFNLMPSACACVFLWRFFILFSARQSSLTCPCVRCKLYTCIHLLAMVVFSGGEEPWIWGAKATLGTTTFTSSVQGGEAEASSLFSIPGVIWLCSFSVSKSM